MKKIVYLFCFIFSFNLAAQDTNKVTLYSLVNLLNKQHDVKNRVDIFHKIIVKSFELNDLVKVKKYSDLLHKISKDNKYEYGLGLYYYCSFYYYISFNDNEKSLYAIENALKYFYKQKKWDKYFESIHLYFYIKSSTNDFVNSKKKLLKAYKLALKLNNNYYLAFVTNDLAKLYDFEFNYSKSLIYYKKALYHVKKSNNYDLIVNVYNNYAAFNYTHSNLKTALEYVNLCLEKPTDDVFNIGLLNLKSKILTDLGQYNQSLSICLNLKKRIDSNQAKYNIYFIDNQLALGTNHQNLKQYEKAISYFKTLDGQIQNNNNDYIELNSKMGLSYAMIHNFKKANFYIDKLISKINMFDLNSQCYIYEAKMAIDSCQKNFKSAFKYCSLFNKVKGKYDDKNQKMNIEKLQIEFDVAVKDNKINKLELEKLKKNNDLKNRKIVIFFMTGFLILFSLFIYLLLKANKKIKIKNNIIALSNTNLQQAQNETKKSLAEKDVLLKEIHHRVKNNLQLIMSLLRVQGNKYDNIIFDDFLNISESRISSMALIHEKLYQSDDLTQINFNDYVVNMTNDISDTFQSTEDKIKIDFDLIPIKFDVQTLIPLALIINELVINAFKHAFKNIKAGRILIKLLQEEEKNILIISDNGAGITIDKDKKSIGLKLVKQLVFQLKAELEIKNFEGTQYQITFKTI